MSNTWKNVTLEMSPKPFKVMTSEAIHVTCREIFRQWDALTRHADMISILLWTADGSEILDYRGQLEDPVEWARYLGMAGIMRDRPAEQDGSGVTLHGRAVLYMDNPPQLSYGTLKEIITTLKEVGTAMTGLPIRVGATFDPGPEFAQSPFKYKRHREILLADTTGDDSFICCYATLNADHEPYAGFPDGIPQGTPLGAFLGRQCQHFMSDLGYDYVWFSNGFGFGYETWGTTGALFDGLTFRPDKAPQIRQDILGFWRAFRAECPHYRIETRGTNLGTGIDLASDGVPLADIYQGNFNMMAPPNSPWAAIDGDFGLELAGYLSHIAELPGDAGYPFRFYLHDPWWINSPWLDRYGREPHDLYLPLSVSRITAQGSVETAGSIDFLTIDNSYGEMPVQCPNEVIPHILAARQDGPDQPGPLVWVYPFKENHALTFGNKPNLEQVFYGDWFMRAAINSGLPVNTIVSSDNLLSSLERVPTLFDGSVLVSPVPAAGSALEQVLLQFVRQGGTLLLFGPTDQASVQLLNALNLKHAAPLSGELALTSHTVVDTLHEGCWPATTIHRPLMCAGGASEVLADRVDPDCRVLATYSQGEEERVAAMTCRSPEWSGGSLTWVRGTNSSYYKRGRPLLVPDDPSQVFLGERLLRWALAEVGYAIRFNKPTLLTRDPITLIARHTNGFYFSGYMPDTTALLQLRFPQGAPLFVGYETEMADGYSQYHLPRGWHRECRIFVEQQDGVISCTEQCSVEVGIHRRIWLRGLRSANVRFYPEPGSQTHVQRRWQGDEAHEDMPYTSGQDRTGSFVSVQNISGELLFSW